MLKLIADGHDRDDGLVGRQLRGGHLVDVERLAGVLVLGLDALEHAGLVARDERGSVALGDRQVGDVVAGRAGLDGVEDLLHVERLLTGSQRRETRVRPSAPTARQRGDKGEGGRRWRRSPTARPRVCTPPRATTCMRSRCATSGRLLFVSGTMGLDAGGTPGATLDEQLQLIWSNLRTILAAAGMTLDNVVRVTSYLRDVEYAEANAVARVAALGERLVPTTAIVVTTLEHDWLVEIEVVAAA